ncbi:MAG: GAF domain-containing protein [Verrucomicrobiota bacterium]
MKRYTDRVADWVAQASQSDVKELMGPTTKFVSSNFFEKMGACEGSLWWRYSETEFLEVCYNSGPNSERIVWQIRQPFSDGIVSLVFHTGEPAYSNQLSDNPDHSKQIDQKLSQQTVRMLASPLVLGGEIVGVASAVVLDPSSAKRFEYADLEMTQHLSEILRSLWERQIIVASEITL